MEGESFGERDWTAAAWREWTADEDGFVAGVEILEQFEEVGFDDV